MMAGTHNAQVDPFTIEIIKEGLLAANEEMFAAMWRTAMSPVIYEVLDYATGVTDARGNLIAQGNGATLFLATISYGVRDVLAKFGADGLQPGDIIATNDPYGGSSTHLSDVTLIMPIFYRDRLVGFAANKAHWTEVGGATPGSWSPHATEIYQEGLQFPCVKVFIAGKALPTVVDMIRANVRLPEMTLGDYYAQAASLRVAGRRVEELCDKYGLETVEYAIERLLEHGRELARQHLQQLPKGTFTAEDFIDDDGTGPVPIQVKLTVTENEFICDFTGSSSSYTPISCSRSGLLSGMRLLWLSITETKAIPNEGLFAPLRVICPEDTVFTATRPHPTSCYWEGMLHSVDLVWKALAEHLPDRIPAGSFLSVCASITASKHPEDGRLVLNVEPQAGGYGASADCDGEDGLVCPGDGETYNLPAEVIEQAYGFLVDTYAFNTEEGGEGKYRGGRGLIKEYRMVHPEGGHFTGIFGRGQSLPWGCAGGEAGSGNYIEVVFADGRPTVRLSKSTKCELGQDDVIRLVTGSGGGYGDPKERPREQVLADLRAGVMGPETARRVYGMEV